MHFILLDVQLTLNITLPSNSKQHRIIFCWLSGSFLKKSVFPFGLIVEVPIGVIILFISECLAILLQALNVEQTCK